jgi:RNA polymerase sigma-70 factor (ECF subfamily)
MSTTAVSAVPAARQAAEGEPSLAELVARAGAGDRGAEGALCRRFAAAVRLFARRRLRTPEAVEEFGQDVMLILIEALRARTVTEPDRLGGFVLGICRNVALDRVRQKERREALWQQHGVTLEQMAMAPPEHAGYEFIHLEDCLSQLPQRSREVVKLAYVDACSADEIASRLRTTAVNARVLRHRTLHTLRDCMSKLISWEATT